MTAGPRPEVAVGAVVTAGGALLLVRRGQEPEAGRWSLPGGRVERGEALASAVEREVLEETGVVVRCGAFVGWVERIAADHHFVILDFFASVTTASAVDEPVAAGGDAAQASWVPLRDVRSLALVSGLEQFLADHGVLDAARS